MERESLFHQNEHANETDTAEMVPSSSPQSRITAEDQKQKLQKIVQLEDEIEALQLREAQVSQSAKTYGVPVEHFYPDTQKEESVEVGSPSYAAMKYFHPDEKTPEEVLKTKQMELSVLKDELEKQHNLLKIAAKEKRAEVLKKISKNLRSFLHF